MRVDDVAGDVCLARSPGLAVRVLGDVCAEGALETVRHVDEIYINSIREAGLLSDCFLVLHQRTFNSVSCVSSFSSFSSSVPDLLLVQYQCTGSRSPIPPPPVPDCVRIAHLYIFTSSSSGPHLPPPDAQCLTLRS